ncbi:RNA-directed DNA polymerase, eukaryota, partial [Tanacetum coccineum]
MPKSTSSSSVCNYPSPEPLVSKSALRRFVEAHNQQMKDWHAQLADKNIELRLLTPLDANALLEDDAEPRDVADEPKDAADVLEDAAEPGEESVFKKLLQSPLLRLCVRYLLGGISDVFGCNSLRGMAVWLFSIRIQSKLKGVLEGVYYGLWWYMWNFRNKLLFDKKIPEKALIFDNLIKIQRLLINKQNLHVVAPWRECDIAGREDATKYAQNHDVPVPVTKFPSSFYRFSLQFNYSSNVNRTTIVCFTSGTLSFKIGTVKESHNELMECWIFATYDLSSIPPAPSFKFGVLNHVYSMVNSDVPVEYKASKASGKSERITITSEK